MKMDGIVYDLCIVGAGFFGSTAARHASANSDLKICLIGLDEPTGSELSERDIYSSHYDEGRIMKHLSSSPAYQKLSHESINRLKNLEDISGIKFYNPVGYLQVGKKGSYIMRNLVDVTSSAGIPFLQIHDQTVMNTIFPFMKLQDDEYGLLDYSGAGIISARKMLEAERQIALQQGCHIIFDKVKEVQPLKDNYHTIETSNHGNIKSRRVLFTTGAFTNVNEFKLLPQLEMYVYKEMAVMVRVPDAEADKLSSMTGLIYKRDSAHIGHYILPPVMYPDGRYYLKVGSMAYDSGRGMQTKDEIRAWFLSEEVPEETESMAEVIFEKIPELKSDGLFRKVCVTCETPTGFPYIDQVTPTVTLAAAGNGWGATTAEEIGRLAAELSLTGIWDSDIPKKLFEIVPKDAL